MANISITGVQLNVGPVAAPFEFKSYERELRECQRYYNRLGHRPGITSASIWIEGYNVSGRYIFQTVTYPSMRDAPNVTFIGGTWTTSNAIQPLINIATSNTMALLTQIVSTGNGYVYNNSSTQWIELEKEL